MYFKPKNITLKPGTAFVVLGDDEVLLSTDICRCKIFVTDYIDEYSEMNMNWQYVGTRLPAWVGKTANEYKQFTKSELNYEIIRIINET